jgi:glycosyltransferase involved in cell wall biosynthesis
MRIAMLANAASVHTVRWANALAERGLQIELISLEKAAPSLTPKVVCHELSMPRPWGYYLAAGKTWRLLRESQPDLLHAHYASGYGTLARRCLYRPAILSVWGSDVYKFPRKSPLHRRLVRKNILSADRVFSTSKAMAEEAVRVCGSLAQLSITPFGVDTELFYPHSGPRLTQSIVIGTVKTLRLIYGVDTLVRGFALCRQQIAHAGLVELADRMRLKIVGDGPERAALERLVAEVGVAPVTQFSGAVPYDRVIEMLHELDVYVAVSRSESFGVAVLEASAVGLPVVVSNVGGLPEVVKKDKTGLIVPPDNPEALAAELSRLVTDTALRQKLGDAGRHYVVENYRWEDCVSRMIELYEEVVGKSVGVTRFAA